MRISRRRKGVMDMKDPTFLLTTHPETRRLRAERLRRHLTIVPTGTAFFGTRHVATPKG